jgi:hypothetical protein
LFAAAACLCISDKLGNIQSIVRKTRDRISVHYLSPEWRSLDRIAKFASAIPTTGARFGQTDELNQDSTEDIATTGNSDNTSDTPVELRKFQDRWCPLFPFMARCKDPPGIYS